MEFSSCLWPVHKQWFILPCPALDFYFSLPVVHPCCTLVFNAFVFGLHFMLCFLFLVCCWLLISHSLLGCFIFSMVFWIYMVCGGWMLYLNCLVSACICSAFYARALTGSVSCSLCSFKAVCGFSIVVLVLPHPCPIFVCLWFILLVVWLYKAG